MLSAVARHRRLNRVWHNPSGLRGASAVNHTVVGKRFMATALFFFFVGGVLAMLIRAQLATPDHSLFGHELYNQFFTMHGTVMMFLFAIPFIEGLAMYLLPKMLGSRDLAYPRLSSFGYWCYLFGGLMLLASLLAGVAPDSGWFFYTPLSSKHYTPGINADFWLLGVTFVEISAICAAVEFVVSILTVRTAGMSLSRMPLFAWYILVTAFMMLFGFPPLILGSILLELERAFDWPFFDAARGGDPILWQHLFWLFGHPEVYIIFLPGAAIVSTLVPVFAGRPIVGYTLTVASVISIGFISFGLWVHHMYTVGIPHLALVFFSAASMLVAVPTAVQFFVWVATLWQGRPRLELPMLYLFGFLVVFVFGGLTGVMVAAVPFDWQVHDTHFVVAHMHYVLVGGLVFPMLAGIYYWFPLVAGRRTFPSLGAIAFWLIFIGFNVTFLIMHFTGLMGMPRRIYAYPTGLGWDVPNLVSSIGGFVMSMGLLLVLIDLVLSWSAGRPSRRDPWNAGTLEWALPTPPPFYNFASQPAVSDRNPLWLDSSLPARIAAGQGCLPGDNAVQQETLGVEMISGRPNKLVVLPRPSWLPLWSGIAMAGFFLLVLAKLYWLAPIGLAAALCVFLRWGWENGARRDPGPDDMRDGLPPHHVADDAPGPLGVIFTLVADATFFASLLFGYAYVWLIAPGPTPPSLADPNLAALLAAGALGAAWAAVILGERALVATRQVNFDLFMLASAGAGIGAVAATAAAFPHMPSPTSHAYAAVVAMLIAYVIFHVVVGVVLSAFAFARRRSGFVSVYRRIDVRVCRIWWIYTAATGLVTLTAVFAVPGVVPA